MPALPCRHARRTLCVRTSHRTQTPPNPRPGHDDRVISVALIAELDRLLQRGNLSLGLARSAGIPAPDPQARPEVKVLYFRSLFDADEDDGKVIVPATEQQPVQLAMFAL